MRSASSCISQAQIRRPVKSIPGRLFVRPAAFGGRLFVRLPLSACLAAFGLRRAWPLPASWPGFGLVCQCKPLHVEFVDNLYIASSDAHAATGSVEYRLKEGAAFTMRPAMMFQCLSALHPETYCKAARRLAPRDCKIAR